MSASLDSSLSALFAVTCRFSLFLALSLILSPFSSASPKEDQDTAKQLLSKSYQAHAAIKQVSMNVWMQYTSLDDLHHDRTQSVASFVKSTDGQLSFAEATYSFYRPLNSRSEPTRSAQLTSYRIEPGPRFITTEFDRAKNKIVNQPISASSYQSKVGGYLSDHSHSQPLFWHTLLGTDSMQKNRNDNYLWESIITGTELVRGRSCIRLDAQRTTLWIDAKTLLIQRMIRQAANKDGKVVFYHDIFYDITPNGTTDPASLGLIIANDYGYDRLKEIPFITKEAVLENIRLSGRAAGSHIATDNASPDAGIAAPDASQAIRTLTEQELSAIITLDGDVCSGLGFVIQTRNQDRVVTDARLLTENRWIKIRDWRGTNLKLIEAHKANDSTVALLKVSPTPNRLPLAVLKRHERPARLLLAVTKNASSGEVQSATCTVNNFQNGYFSIYGEYAKNQIGSPIIDPATGVVGMITELSYEIAIKQDPEYAKFHKPDRKLSWFGQSIFTGGGWSSLGLVPQK